MKVGIVVSPGMAHHETHAEAMRAGLARHRVEATVYPEGYVPSEETVCCWGWRLGKPLRAAGKDVLVLERGYMGDRTQWTSMGWNALNGRARFTFGDDSRVHLFERLLRPWRPAGDYALIVGQVSGDAAVDGVDMAAFYDDCVSASRNIFGLPARFRPHPVALSFGQQHRVPAPHSTRALQDDLDGAAVVITWNSNTGVDAVLAGKPTIAFDRGSMAWPVTAHEYRIPDEPDREAWLEAMSWCQFSLEEIRSGLAWEHVSSGRSKH